MAARRPLVAVRRALVLTLAVNLGHAAWAQQGPVAPEAPAGGVLPRTPIVTLDQDRLFRDSGFGKAAVARAETAATELAAENRRLEAALEAEERDLTARRATLPTAEFAPLAAAFDKKVEEIRAAQDAKSRAITRRLEEERESFFEAAVPVLGDLLNDTGAVAILANDAIILSLTSLDVTDEAVIRMDATLAQPDAPAP